MLTRRQFIRRSAAELALPAFWQAPPRQGTFYIGVIADSHVIDPFYQGPESNPEDSESIFKTSERLGAARDALNAATPRQVQLGVMVHF